MPVVEIEVDSDTNGDLMFEPLRERVRGAFQPARVRQESAGKLAMLLPKGIPGQRIRLNPESGTGEIIEPLAAPEHADTLRVLAKLLTGDEGATAARLEVAPAVRIMPGVHVPTWLAYMIRAVKAGYARVTMGTLPDSVPADAKPRIFSSLSRPQTDAKDKMIDTLTALLMAKLSPNERKELAGVLGSK